MLRREEELEAVQKENQIVIASEAKQSRFCFSPVLGRLLRHKTPRNDRWLLFGQPHLMNKNEAGFSPTKSGLKPNNVNDFLIHELKLVAINLILIQFFPKCVTSDSKKDPKR